MRRSSPISFCSAAVWADVYFALFNRVSQDAGADRHGLKGSMSVSLAFEHRGIRPLRGPVVMQNGAALLFPDQPGLLLGRLRRRDLPERSRLKFDRDGIDDTVNHIRS